MSIGRGWILITEKDELQQTAKELLKEKLTDIWNIIQEKHEQRIINDIQQAKSHSQNS
ncbi:MAG: hypothetical protein ACYC6W_11100 [Nitrosotalea sp.]